MSALAEACISEVPVSQLTDQQLIEEIRGCICMLESSVRRGAAAVQEADSRGLELPFNRLLMKAFRQLNNTLTVEMFLRFMGRWTMLDAIAAKPVEVQRAFEGMTDWEVEKYIRKPPKPIVPAADSVPTPKPMGKPVAVASRHHNEPECRAAPYDPRAAVASGSVNDVVDMIVDLVKRSSDPFEVRRKLLRVLPALRLEVQS